MRTMNQTDILRALKLIRQVEPSQEATERALRRAAAAIAPPAAIGAEHRKHRRPGRQLLLVPAALAALLLLAIILLPGSNSARAAELESVLSRTAAYSGWVSMIPRPAAAGEPAPPTVRTYNTADGTLAWITSELERLRIILMVPASLECWRYDSQQGVITLTSLQAQSAAQQTDHLADSIRWDTLLARMREYGQSVEVTSAPDGPWQRFELRHTTATGSGELRGTDTLWADPTTGLIQRLRTERNGRTVEFDIQYNAAPIASIHDLGVPATAPIHDDRTAADPSGLGIHAVQSGIPAPLDKQHLLDIVTQRQALLASFRVAYTDRVDPAVENAILRGRYDITVSGEKRRIDRQYSLDAAGNGYEHHMIVAFDGQFHTRRHISHRDTYSRSTTGGHDIDLQTSLFIVINLLTPPRGQDGEDQSLISLLQSHYSSVRPHLEIVGGRACHVLDAPRLTVWIDAERGAIPIRTIARHPHDAGRIDAEWVADHAEPVDGVWYITRGRRFSAASDHHLMSLPETITHMAVERRPNGTPDIEFNPAIGPETFNLFHNLPPNLPAWQVADEVP